MVEWVTEKGVELLTVPAMTPMQWASVIIMMAIVFVIGRISGRIKSWRVNKNAPGNRVAASLEKIAELMQGNTNKKE